MPRYWRITFLIIFYLLLLKTNCGTRQESKLPFPTVYPTLFLALRTRCLSPQVVERAPLQPNQTLLALLILLPMGKHCVGMERMAISTRSPSRSTKPETLAGSCVTSSVSQLPKETHMHGAFETKPLRIHDIVGSLLSTPRTASGRTQRSSSAALTIRDSRSADAAVAALVSGKGNDPIMIFQDNSDSETNEKWERDEDTDVHDVVYELASPELEESSNEASRRTSSRSLRESRGHNQSTPINSSCPLLSTAMTAKDSLVADAAMAGLRLLRHKDEDRPENQKAKQNERRDPAPGLLWQASDGAFGSPVDVTAARRLERLSSNRILTQEDSIEADIAIAGLTKSQLPEDDEVPEEHSSPSNTSSPRSQVRRNLAVAMKSRESLLADVAMASLRVEHSATPKES